MGRLTVQHQDGTEKAEKKPRHEISGHSSVLWPSSVIRAYGDKLSKSRVSALNIPALRNLII
jgi:hypothetical protein